MSGGFDWLFKNSNLKEIMAGMYIEFIKSSHCFCALSRKVQRNVIKLTLAIANAWQARRSKSTHSKGVDYGGF
jgi:hypothetical protein